MPETAIQPQNGSYLTPTLAHATVADAMHPGIVSCDADDTLTNVARAMANHHVHCIVVTRLSHDRSGEQVVWGLISDLDLLKGSLSSPAEPNAAALARQ